MHNFSATAPSHAKGMTGYLNASHIPIFDFSNFSQPLTEQIRTNVQRIADENGIEIEFIRTLHDFRKDDRIQVILHKTGKTTLTGDFYTVGEVLGHTLAGIGVPLGLSMNFEAVTACCVDVRLERKKEVLDTYHDAAGKADAPKATETEPKKAKGRALLYPRVGFGHHLPKKRHKNKG